MAKSIRIAVLRARHDKSVATISDQSCRDLIFTNGFGTALFQYWTSNTNNHLRLTGELLPWIDVALDAQVPRELQGKAAFDAYKEAGRDLDEFDGYLLFVLPGFSLVRIRASRRGQPSTMPVGFDGGAYADVGRGSKQVAVLPVSWANHTFMCHEMGHVLGVNHSYGILNNGVEWDNQAPWDQGHVYGDPYDIMSSAAFGSRWLDAGVTHYFSSPVFRSPPISGWPNSGAMDSLGPAPARAQVHFWDPNAFNAMQVQHVDLPQGVTKSRTRLFRASPGGNRRRS